MNTKGQPDTSVYLRLREHALSARSPGAPPHAIQAVLMDWHVPTGNATALATADGTASIYLSAGGGFLNGGHKYPDIRTSAQHAVNVATDLLPHFSPAPSHQLPPPTEIFFFAITGTVLLRASGSRAAIESGSSPLAPLAQSMQAVIAAYRASYA